MNSLVGGLEPPISAAIHFLAPLAMIWLAWIFGRSLRRGAMPLIERIARQGRCDLPAPLILYTRRLTAVWSIYLVAAAVLVATARLPHALMSLAAWGGSVVLFVGEHQVRARLFPAEVFPGLIQQVRDTWSIWRMQH